MEERERLIGRLDQSRRAMQAMLLEIDTGQEIYPQWTIKQVLAHIAGWDDVVTGALEAHANGKVPATLPVKGVDAYNQMLAQACETLAYEQVVNQWRLARRRLKAMLSELAEDRFHEAIDYPWGWRGNIARAVAILADHELEHAAEIRELLSTGESLLPDVEEDVP